MAGATLFLTNHSEYDNAYTKARLTELRKPGEPSPFDVGKEGIQRVFTVMAECAAAMKLEAMAKE